MKIKYGKPYKEKKTGAKVTPIEKNPATGKITVQGEHGKFYVTVITFIEGYELIINKPYEKLQEGRVAPLIKTIPNHTGKKNRFTERSGILDNADFLAAKKKAMEELDSKIEITEDTDLQSIDRSRIARSDKKPEYIIMDEANMVRDPDNPGKWKVMEENQITAP